MKLSLWLLPDAPTSDILRHHIQRLADTASSLSSSSSLPTHSGPFVPHITVLGGIHVENEQECERLQNRLKQFLGVKDGDGPMDGWTGGIIECELENPMTPTVMLVEDNGGTADSDESFSSENGRKRNLPLTWNQCVTLSVRPSEKFLALHDACVYATEPFRSCASGPCIETEVTSSDRPLVSLFPPPLQRPHISLYYSEDELPFDIIGDKETGMQSLPLDSPTVPSKFEAHTVELWCTDPSSVEGVKEWKSLWSYDLRLDKKELH